MQTKIIDYGMNGEGVSKLDGKVTLVDFALVDEVVDIELITDNGNYAIAKLNNVIKPSCRRTNPTCPYFYECGGCQLQHMNYEEQLLFKTNHVKKTIKKITGFEFDVNKTVACNNQFTYRNKMSFSVNNLNCGLLKQNSKEIVNISSCPLADSAINKVLKLYNGYINKYNITNTKNLVVRAINNQILVGVVTTQHIDLKDFLFTLSQHFNNVGLYEIIDTRKDSVVLSGKVVHVGGIKTINITNFNLNYSVDLIGFHQTNLEIQNKLYESVLKYIDCQDVVINGFSGQGLLSAIIVQKAKQVIGIELNKNSHQSAESLKLNNKIKNLKNICGDFHKHIKSEIKKANTVILDPPKKGCGKVVMEEIKGVQKIIYISCNPIALSKDLRELLNDYTIEEITPFDMFPNTSSVETLVKLKIKE